MIIVTLFVLWVLHAETAARKCIAGDCMSGWNPEIQSGENFYVINSLNNPREFGDFFTNFQQLVQQMYPNSPYENIDNQPPTEEVFTNEVENQFTNEAEKEFTNEAEKEFTNEVQEVLPNEVEEVLTNEIDGLHDFLNYSIPCGVQGRSGSSSGYDSNRVVGGSNSHPGEFPWQISLQLVTGWTARHICGGSVINENWVVTAAHCVYGLSEDLLSVVAGKNNLYTPESYDQRVNVAAIHFDGYNKQKFSRDIALLKVYPPLALDYNRVSPICIPKPGTQFDNALAFVTGWGRVSESGSFAHVLQKVRLPLYPVNTCLTMYNNAGYGEYVSPCVLCGGGSVDHEADSCQGDSGGPLSCLADDNRFYLCGIVSWGLGCARPNYPGVYTAVSCYSDFIKDTVTYG